jgi:hypothetical protein
LKCDERQPQCQKCLAFGVVCNYNTSHNQDLQPKSLDKTSRAHPEGSFGEVVFNVKPRPQSILLRPATVIGSGPGSFQLDSKSIGRLDRFLRRTVYTFAGNPTSTVYQNHVTSIAIEVSYKHAYLLESLSIASANTDHVSVQNPFLMHVILTMTARHDRFLSSSKDHATRSIAEAYHWSQGAALLNRKLSAPIRPQDRDALWAAAAILGLLSIADIEASTPWEAWPLKSSEPSDLRWMNMSHGKKAIWQATDPMRPDSIFHAMRDDYRTLMSKPALCEMHDMPRDFVALCQLGRTAEPTQNPYFTAVSLLTRLWHLKCTQATMTRYMQFLGFMDPAFKSLLHEKDPRALLILAYWYGPMSDSLWWMARRARLECQAICMYLELFHPHEKDIQLLLAQPKEQCGLPT